MSKLKPLGKVLVGNTAKEVADKAAIRDMVLNKEEWYQLDDRYKLYLDRPSNVPYRSAAKLIRVTLAHTGVDDTIAIQETDDHRIGISISKQAYELISQYAEQHTHHSTESVKPLAARVTRSPRGAQQIIEMRENPDAAITRGEGARLR